MPGRPKLQKLEQHIEQLGGDDVVFDMIAAGEPMRKVAENLRGFLEGAPEFPSRPYIYRWIHHGGEERERAWEEAKEIAAHCHVEDSGEILDDAQHVTTSAEASMAKARAEHRKWLAGVFNREDYGEKKEEVGVNVSIGALHLDALRSSGRMSLPEDQIEGDSEQGRVEEADYELVEGEAGG